MKKKGVKLNNWSEINKVHHCNFLENTLPDKCANLIIADPPYYKVKGDFDFIWKTFEYYLKDVEKWAVECKRLLADNGSLLWYGHAKNIAYSQIIFDKYFNLENNLVWWVYDRRTNKGIEKFRSFAPVTERILFYSNEINKTGLQKIYDSPDCFKSIKKYMRDERSEVIKENNFKTIEEFNLYIRKVTDTSSVVDHHYFADSQYVFPTEEMYKKLQTTGFWRREYEELRREYEELCREYEELRRPFNNELKLTDVIKFSQEGHKIKKYDHETVKPEALTTALIEKCSRKGDLVVIPFSGSGTECAMSAKSSRDFIAYDIEKKYADMSNERASHEISQGILF